MTEQGNSDDLAIAVARHLHANEGTSAAWNLRFVDAGEGWATCALTIREDMLNGHKIAHGGIIFALADTAFAWACNSRNVSTVAQQAQVSFLSPGRLGETLTAKAQEESVSGRTGVYSVKVTGDEGRVIAVFQGLSRTIGGPVIDQDGIDEEENSNG